MKESNWDQAECGCLYVRTGQEYDDSGRGPFDIWAKAHSCPEHQPVGVS